MTDDVLKTTIESKVGDHIFVFKIPSLHDEIRVGSKMGSLRRKIDPDWDGATELEYNEAFLLRACATFECLRQQSSEKWVWAVSNQGKPICDSSKFPEDKVLEVVEAYRGYGDQLRTFRQAGLAGQQLPAQETVESKSDTGGS
jgi:hypothetical protein